MFRTIGNSFFEARFDGNTGALMGMYPVGETTPIVAGARVQYRIENVGAWVSGDAGEVISARLRGGRAESTLATEHLRIKRVFTVLQGEPLMKIRYEFSAVKACRLMDPGLLHLALAEDLNDVSRDEKDLYFDGAEIGGNRELPCWRVLYRAGHKRGVMVAARSKWQMSHLMYGTSGAKGIEVRPHVRAQQELGYWKRDIEIDMPVGMTRVVELEIGPWWAHRHKEIIRAAGLDKPRKVAPTEPVEHAKMPMTGKVLWAADWAPLSAVSKVYHPGKWLVTASPGKKGKKSLVANADCRPAGFVIRPGVSGPCRVWVGGNISAVLGLKFGGDKCATYRSNESRTVFHSVMNDAGQKTELDFGVVDLTGKTIRVVPNHNGHWPARLDYLRLEPLEEKEAGAWKARGEKPLKAPLVGIPDVGDTFFYQLDRRTLDGEVVRESVWAHAKAGFTRMYWQMHGTYTGFPTKIGTMAPLMCWAHGAFEPQAKAGGLFYRKHDLLKLVMEYGREMGVEVWGAARMNAYMSGKKDEFFKKHPEYAEITEDGTTSGNKICYAIPEVRAYHRSILVEAAGYGLPGIMLGFLRHPPIFLYHPVLVGGYRAKFGKLPPREPGRADQFYHGSLAPTDEEHVRWFGYRAEFMTRFGRELKQDLRNAGLGHVKVSIWVRPNHCLFDGIDIDAWLGEGLCDEVVADIYPEDMGPLTEPVEAWKKKVQAKVPLIKGIGMAQMHMEYGAKNLRRIANEGYDGVCSYESELFVQSPGDLALLDLMR
jgi:hypothetical protein